MELNINNVFGIKSAKIDFPVGATIVTGKNSAGKSSVALTLAAVLAQDGNPADISSRTLSAYVKDGSSVGDAEMNGVRWVPQTGIKAPPGTSPFASPFSVGLVDFVNTGATQKSRMEIWEEMFIPSNPKNLLKQVWTLTDVELENVVNIINEGGWPDALDHYETQRKVAKRQWCDLTGSPAYGVKKAAQWLPQGWTPEMNSASPASLKSEAKAIRLKMQKASNAAAISQAEIDRAKEINMVDLPKAEAELESLRKGVEKSKSYFDEIESEINTTEKKHNELREWMVKASGILQDAPPHNCPHCGKGVNLQDGDLIPWVEVDPEKRLKIADAYKEVKDRLVDAQKRIATRKVDLLRAQENIDSYRSKMNTQMGVIEALKKGAENATAVATEVQDINYDDLEKELMECNLKLDMLDRKAQAQKAHDSVVILDEVCEILGPNGAKVRHLEESMNQLRDMLVRVNKVTGWMPIDINDEFEITSGGRPAKLCAYNEKLKAQWSMQVACAYLTKSKWIIMDEADTLKDESWDGLVKLVNGLCSKIKDLRIIVCATSTQVPEWNEVSL